MSDHKPSSAPGREPEDGGHTPDIFEARITGTEQALAEVLRTSDLDIGCRRPHFERHSDRTATLLVFATEQRIGELRAAGYSVEKGENLSTLGRTLRKEVGKGDRFEGGRRVPKGLGLLTDDDDGIGKRAS